jgi:hypothetical protein
MTYFFLIAASALLCPCQRLPLAGVLLTPQGSRRLREWMESAAGDAPASALQPRRPR